MFFTTKPIKLRNHLQPKFAFVDFQMNNKTNEWSNDEPQRWNNQTNGSTSANLSETGGWKQWCFGSGCSVQFSTVVADGVRFSTVVVDAVWLLAV